jgi:hypothetical protein
MASESSLPVAIAAPLTASDGPINSGTTDIFQINEIQVDSDEFWDIETKFNASLNNV